MYNTEALTFTNKEIENIQIEENKTYRYILNAPTFIPTAALGREIGASRMIKSNLNFVRHVLNDNPLLKEIFLTQYNSQKNNKWIKQIK